ncbi:uncharacterized protein LOC131012296 isoform X2 [Salvia miltiorrhiza]|uniref:uncharacterized protein LOC131012296 isoform X2 n=1 Tax=Salvia miltiorrhiza TaxID=226208 RepID=UPI0025ABB2FA|nr:uncharacterized protein LOC131012296 isoform X2 [Salvia miltiorrhiza]XP_057796205.1 uncharacterized protein LOC131012296 isoform X2 [Salvia miltiorrhiza]XP_057796206.1 uncharacterized protein LOC131012296 isoform X2 [Salvia miltiorrhiza]XP_057796207.1 uncharacterized protein LOC131012296 isoform X2 [Salvia miltiorrhiza]XP_057796208.1 uncharacterized protein LOC131012296 isoform X2 [Salvia miltiorrhiza]XP_057796209.1 uncharacterized protein LOC131012296 isoform X2 [Salvia miltiorrhiza]
MLLKNLMEDKQLNFDQPFLSVRRHAPPTVTSQKRDNKRIDSYSYQVRPQLPTYRSELKSGPIRNPGAVPFLWEHSPGQPKEEAKPQTRSSDKPPIAPMLPPGRYPKAKQHDSRIVSRRTTGIKSQAVDAPCTSEDKKQDVPVSCDSRTGLSNDEDVKNDESRKDTPKEEEGGSDSEDSNEAYVDARDTLSRTEYSFLNCSMSGLSGVEDLDVKSSERFSTDPQAREFMMDRFLPAAKAMASETPHAPKKQPMQVQQQQQPKKTTNQCTKPSLRYGPSFAKKYSHYHENEEEEEESDDEYDQQANMRSVCGLLPRFCLKSSLGLLSPVPGMSVRTRVPASPANRGQPRSSSSGSYTEMENESISGRTETKSIDKIQTAELDEDKATSTYSDAPLPLHEQKEAPSVHEGITHGKGLKTFEEFLLDHGSSDQSSSGDPVVEKTVYVDTVHKAESPNLRPFSPKTPDSQIVPNLIEEDSPHEDLKKLHTADGETQFLPKAESIANQGKEKPPDFGDNRNFSIDSTNKDYLAVTLYGSQQNHSGLPAPPPLPKSPSDSWLWRTLPSMNTKNSPLRTYLGAETAPENKAPASDMKWETIVKTTKVQRRHMHYSEESLTSIPET